MVGVGICGCGVRGEESDGGVSARERVGEEVSKANKKSFNDGGKWKVRWMCVEWS